MNYFQKKKLAFMSIVNKVKGFVRTISGILPLTLEGCVDEESIIDYTLYGNSVQNGTPTPETPVEVESVGEKTDTTYEPYGYKIPVTVSGKNILKFSYYKSSVKLNGITANGNSDGSITLNGTCTGQFQLGLAPYAKFTENTSCRLYAYPTATDKYYIYSRNGYRATENGTSISILNDINNIYLNVVNGATFDNFTIYPMMVIGGKAGETFEPYHEPITTNIYLDEPLGEGQSISHKKDGLPKLPTFKGTSIIAADTTIQPSNVEIEYYSNVKE